jgi:hypothetical protein
MIQGSHHGLARLAAIALVLCATVAVEALAAIPAAADTTVSATLVRGLGARLTLHLSNIGTTPIQTLALQLARTGFDAAGPFTPAATCGRVAAGTVGCSGLSVPPGGTLDVSFQTTSPYAVGGGAQLTVSADGLTDVGPLAVAGPLLPAPVAARSELATPTLGAVLVRTPGTRQFTRLKTATLLPNGSELDVTHGVLSLTVAREPTGTRTDTAIVSQGRAKVSQAKGAHPGTTLTLSAPLACRRGSHARRQLFVRERSGRFGTIGRYGAATARGATWLTTDTCSSTTVNVVLGRAFVQTLPLPGIGGFVPAGQQGVIQAS